MGPPIPIKEAETKLDLIIEDIKIGIIQLRSSVNLETKIKR